MKEILNKFGGRFVTHHTFDGSVPSFTNLPLIIRFTIKDTFDGDIFTIQIDSLAGVPEIILENVLREKIINKREQKIDYIINGTTT